MNVQASVYQLKDIEGSGKALRLIVVLHHHGNHVNKNHRHDEHFKLLLQDQVEQPGTKLVLKQEQSS